MLRLAWSGTKQCTASLVPVHWRNPSCPYFTPVPARAQLSAPLWIAAGTCKCDGCEAPGNPHETSASTYLTGPHRVL